jgi:hypothetical protein
MHRPRGSSSEADVTKRRSGKARVLATVDYDELHNRVAA